MDMSIIATIFLSAAGVVALLILFMTLEPAYLKKMSLLAVLMFVAPLLIALLGNSLGWFDVYTIEIITLRQGAFSIVVAGSYGVMAGVILNSIKMALIKTFRKKQAEEKRD